MKLGEKNNPPYFKKKNNSELPVYESNTKGIPYFSFVPEVGMDHALHRVTRHVSRRQGQESLTIYRCKNTIHNTVINIYMLYLKFKKHLVK